MSKKNTKALTFLCKGLTIENGKDIKEIPGNGVNVNNFEMNKEIINIKVGVDTTNSDVATEAVKHSVNSH